MGDRQNLAGEEKYQPEQYLRSKKLREDWEKLLQKNERNRLVQEKRKKNK